MDFGGNELILTCYKNDEVKITHLGITLTIIIALRPFISMIAQKYDDYNNLRIGYDMVSKTETIYETSENSITSINEKNIAEKPAYVDMLIRL